MDRCRLEWGVAWRVLLALPLLAGCATNPIAPQKPALPQPVLATPLPSAPKPVPVPALAPAQSPAQVTGAHVALLAPLTAPGATGLLAQALLRASQIALEGDGAPTFTAHDTSSDPAAAARAAIGAGARVIVGPLTSAETDAVAPPAAAAHIPILAFTSDAGKSRPGIWVMGLTPAEQTARLVSTARAHGRQRPAALLPAGQLGDAFAAGLVAAIQAQGGPPAQIERYASAADLQAAITRLTTPTAAPFDALLLTEAGKPLATLLSSLAAAGLSPERVLLLGPAFWAPPASGPSTGPIGGWYAAPPPAARAPFVQVYTARAGAPPPPLADIGFDAAAIARLAAGAVDPVAALTRPEGYLGADGPLTLQPNGEVRRGLSVFAVDRAGSHLIDVARTGS